MADNSKKLSELPTAANVAGTDRILVLRDPSGSPTTRTITVNNFKASIASSSNTIQVGDIYSINATATELNFNVDAYNGSNTESSNSGFKWFAGGFELAKLERDGHLVINKIRSRLNSNLSLYVNGGAQTWEFTTENKIITPTYSEISTPRAANTKYALSYYDQSGLWGGYTQYDQPEGNSSWAWVGTDNTDIDNPYVVLEVRADDGSYTTWKFDSDLKRNGVSVIGTGQIDGGNAFTSPTAEITVDGGGA